MITTMRIRGKLLAGRFTSSAMTLMSRSNLKFLFGLLNDLRSAATSSVFTETQLRIAVEKCMTTARAATRSILIETQPTVSSTPSSFQIDMIHRLPGRLRLAPRTTDTSSG